MSDKKVLCIDLDDTIVHNADPEFLHYTINRVAVERVRKLFSLGFEVVVFTSRGQISCNCDLQLIERKYRTAIENFLQREDIPFSKLVFGKPIADLYVDDKAINVREFCKDEICVLNGNSNNLVVRVGDVVIKEHATQEKAILSEEWFAKAKMLGINAPEVFSRIYSKLYLQYVGFSESFSKEYIPYVMYLISKERSIRLDELTFNANRYCENLRSHLSEECVFELCNRILEFKNVLRMSASFCHGDMTISNMILNQGRIFLLDPNWNKSYSSWLLDASKFRFSVNGGEFYLNGTSYDEEILREFDLQFVLKYGHQFLSLVKILEASHWVRLCKYCNGDKEKLLSIIREKIGSL